LSETRGPPGTFVSWLNASGDTVSTGRWPEEQEWLDSQPAGGELI